MEEGEGVIGCVGVGKEEGRVEGITGWREGGQLDGCEWRG
jgi:hypothetical protein